MIRKDTRYDVNFLYFDEGPHKYTDTLNNDYISVTTLIGNYYPHFDVNKWAHIKAKEQNKSEKEIKKEWDRIKDEACDRGTKTHNGLEDAIKNVSKFANAIEYLTNYNTGRCITVADIPNLIPKPLNIEEFKKATDNKYEEIYRVFDYYIKKGYTIYSEIGAYLIDYGVSGTIDILCIKEDNFVILDWKTNRDGLKFEAGYYKKDKSTVPNQLTMDWVLKNEKMLPPLAHLDNCNGNHYTIQLSMYALMVEIILGIPCVGVGLCHIGSPWVLNKHGQPYRDSDGYHVIEDGEETVKWYRISYLRDECISLLKDRYISFKKNNKNVNIQLNLFT